MNRVEQLIFDQVSRTPDAVAVEHNGARLTYRELRSQAQEISRGLRNAGLQPGGTAAVFQHRSLTTLPLLLAIWNAGGIVVPINPKTPLKMLEWVIKDSAPQVIITEPAFKPLIVEAVSSLNGNSRPPILAGERSNGHVASSTDDLRELPDDCYVIYTSGSEGRPKGVKGSHQSLIHYLKWQAKEFSVFETDRFSQTAPLSFDFSLKELLVPLICGARVCIADRTTVIDPRKFLEWIHDSSITVMCCVPTLLRSLLRLPDDGRSFQSMRSVLISGDMLRWNDVISWRERFGDEITLFNLYGPTESTVVKLFYPIPQTKCPESVNVPVGKPIEGATVLLLDKDGEPTAPGEIGEIVILSEWLARGYHSGEQKSFCRVSYRGKQRRAYRTGDLGRWLSDGNLELIGRKDRQVKIRGYRIELDEIESILSEHPGIRDVAAVVSNPLDADGLAAIVCYFTAGERRVTEKELRIFAQERLLPQMLSLIQFSRLDKLPLTVNGKVDRLKLESLFETTETHEVDRSTNGDSLTVQQRLLAIWEELLAVDAIDLQANFFELGGDSMTAIRLLRRIREELHAEVKLGDVYEFPSIATLSDRVEQLLACQSALPQESLLDTVSTVTQ
jgi:amino acid adenylation domain-containing protein